MDEGLPIAYEVLDKGVPVISSDGQQVGTVHHVVAAPEQDIFHGLVISVPGGGRRFVEAADVEQLHERGVDLRIDAAAAEGLSEPGGGAPVYDEDPSAINKWSHWTHRLTGRMDWHRRE
jgi:sporulation protein YlmC with PRC-barrel domain